MLTQYELDIPVWNNERDVSLICSPRSTSHGDEAARDVKEWLLKNGTHLPTDARYLALGAGQAYHEVAFARHLGIASENVTMVDRRFSDSARRRLMNRFRGVELVESGIFAFLTNPPKRNFSLISAFGIEYVFAQESAPETFATLIPDLISKGGVVYIRFYGGRNIDPLWRHNGFKVIHGYKGSICPEMYVYHRLVRPA